MEMHEILDKYPDLVRNVREQFNRWHRDLFEGKEPLPEVADYVVS